jgi:hypothetical protein
MLDPLRNRRRPRGAFGLLSFALAALVLAAAALAACGSTSNGSFDARPGSGDGGGIGDSGVGSILPPGPVFEGGLGTDGGLLAISPSSATLAVTLGTSPTIPTQQFTVTYGGIPVAAQFTIDKGQIGSVGVATGLFTPGKLGGTATLTATYQGNTATAPITVNITYLGVGDPNAPDAGAGAGGYGGVGGQGEGPPASPGQVTTLNGTATADPAVTFLYPYDKTVFPQAVLPPLLQWTIGSHNFDGVYIHIKETYYEYKGYFAAPTTPGLDGGPGGPFQNHPVPQTAWDALAYSNAGETVSVSLTFSEGSKAIGPITESWIFAPGELKGTIYYNSYGTRLVYNYTGALGPNTNFGAATLAIKEGQTSPTLIAGADGCRVCHAVAAGGSTLVTQQGNANDYTSAVYTLTSPDAGGSETVPANNNGSSLLAWPAIYPDGTMLFSNCGPLSGAGSTSPSSLYSTSDGSSIASTGLNGIGGLTPAFSPDGTHVAFNMYTGATADGGAADQHSLSVIDFAPTTKAFSNARFLTNPAGGPAYWPSFLPTNDGVIYEVETRANTRTDLAGTRGDNDSPYDTTEDGAHAELWWVDLKTMTPTRLDALNGLTTSTGVPYLPAHATAVNPTTADVTLNYEPTVNPVPSGGYAWVVFTSRRMYGNVATVNPYWSDPRNEDLSSTPTTKKLWVAAIDLNATPGKDPSHPAFYLPAQELLAGNARGFWVVDPCQKDGTSCITGDECCGGYCRNGEDGGLECTATQPSCSQQYEKCTTTADCCGASIGIQCIDGFCSQSGPK